MDVNQISCGPLCHVQNQSNYQNLVKHVDTWVVEIQFVEAIEVKSSYKARRYKVLEFRFIKKWIIF